jgi:hypothetical protein
VLGTRPRENATFYSDLSNGAAEPVPVSSQFIFDGLVQVPNNKHYNALITLLGGRSEEATQALWSQYTDIDLDGPPTYEESSDTKIDSLPTQEWQPRAVFHELDMENAFPEDQPQQNTRNESLHGTVFMASP